MENVPIGKCSDGKCSNFPREILENILKKLLEMEIVLIRAEGSGKG